MLVFLYLSLFLALLTIFHLTVTGTTSKQHRLLPLLLGLISVYDFYLIAEQTHQLINFFSSLKDMLVIQIICLITFCAIDFLQCHFPKWLQALNFLTVFTIITLIFNNILPYSLYYPVLRGYSLINAALIVYLGIYSMKQNDYMHRALIRWLPEYIFLLIPSLVIQVVGYSAAHDHYLVVIFGTALCVLVNLSISTGALIDLSSEMESKAFIASDVATIFLDKNYNFVNANTAAKRLFNVDFTSDEVADNIKKQLVTTSGIYEKMGHAVKYPFQDMVLEQLISPVYKKKRLMGYSITIIDVTDSEKEKIRIQEEKLHAQEVAEAKGRFLADMSHELRSPVHAIIGSCDIILNKSFVSPSEKSLLLYVKNAGNDLLERINSILLYSKLEAKKVTLNNREYNLKDTITSVAQTTTINLQDSLVSFKVRILTPLPEKLIGDQAKVKGILQNLLTNAVKYTKEGFISCNVTAEQINGSWKLSFEVIDSGCGMTPEQIIEATNAYSSFANEMVVESTGLGLPIVKETVQLMDGDLLIESDGKTGTKVVAYFYQTAVEESGLVPAGEVSKADILYGNMFVTTATSPDFVYPKAKVLMADDMAINRTVFEKLVAPWQFELTMVSNGKEAIEAASLEKYDLIFLDQMMPVMDGFEAVEQIKEISSAPLVLFTANISGDIKEKAISAGFTDYLEKPIPMEQLKNILETLLPNELALPYEEEAENDLFNHQSLSNYVKNLRVYYNEMQRIHAELPDLFPGELSLFKTKIHGVKSASKQIGKEAFGTLAEVFEMASACENTRFIENNIAYLYTGFDEFLEEVEKELFILEQKIAEDEGNITNIGDQSESPEESASDPQLTRASALSELLAAFEDYDVNKIDYINELIAKQKLLDNTKEFCEKVSEYRAELEYEDGAEYVKSFM